VFSRLGQVSTQGITFTVNSTDDLVAGGCDATHCSLREAINAANAAAGTDVIAFNIPGVGPHPIGLADWLPTITDPVIVDGTTQPGFAGTPIIQVFPGDSPNEIGEGLRITAGNSLVRGLSIYGFRAYGIIIRDNGGNVIQGNSIGRNGVGILVADSSNNTIGGTTPDAGNIIAENDEASIALASDINSVGNSIRGNSIYGNGGLGIDLRNNWYLGGVTPNDAGDLDTGTNNYQNFPVLTSVMTSNSGITIEGTLNSTPNTLFHLDFYASSACDFTGYGEGEALRL
jgi:CSLREA domain-containing protein